MHSDADGTLAVIAPSVDHGLIHKLVLIGNMVFSERILPTVELFLIVDITFSAWARLALSVASSAKPS